MTSMKTYADFKLSTKLILGFTILVVLSGLVCIVSITGLYTTSDSYKDLFRNYGDSQGMLGEVYSAYTDNSVQLRDMLHASDEVKQPEYFSTLKRNDETILTKLGEYESTCKLPEDKASYKELVTALDAYKVVRDNYTALILKGDHTEAALVLRSTEFTDLALNVREVMAKCIAGNRTIGKSIADKLNSSVVRTGSLLILMLIVSSVVGLVLGLSIARSISKPLKKMMLQVERLAKGDFTPIEVLATKDEVGELSRSLNVACSSLRELVVHVKQGVVDLNDSVKLMTATTDNISNKMQDITLSVMDISEGAEGLSSTTEEVNASIEEITCVTQELSNKAAGGSKSVVEIKARAAEIKAKGQTAVNLASHMFTENIEQVNKAIEDGKVVSKIKLMADTIASLASQTNLLALNAAIDAARAGEQGRGFAVVADEVKKLAEQSTQTVSEIKRVISSVEQAFVNLTQSSQGMLSFIEGTVKQDYAFMVKSGEMYGDDAIFVSKLAEDLALASKSMSETVEQVSLAIQNITDITEESATRTSDVLGSVNQTSEASISMTQYMHTQLAVVDNLTTVVGAFKI